MKKLLTLWFILITAMTVCSQNEGLFKYKENQTTETQDAFDRTNHNATINDWHSDHEAVLYGTGVAVLTALGVGYTIIRKNKKKPNNNPQ